MSIFSDDSGVTVRCSPFPAEVSSWENPILYVYPGGGNTTLCGAHPLGVDGLIRYMKPPQYPLIPESTLKGYQRGGTYHDNVRMANLKNVGCIQGMTLNSEENPSSLPPSFFCQAHVGDGLGYNTIYHDLGHTRVSGFYDIY